MKTMFRYIFIGVCLPLLVMGCQKNDVIPEVETGEEKMCEITLQMGGELSAEYSPLTKVTGTWYAFNVKRRTNSQTEYSDYLIGYYNDIRYIKMYVPQGYQYLVECSSIANTNIEIVYSDQEEVESKNYYIQKYKYSSGMSSGYEGNFFIKYPFTPNTSSSYPKYPYYVTKTGKLVNQFHSYLGELYNASPKASTGVAAQSPGKRITSIPTLAEGNTSARYRYYGTVEFTPTQNGNITLNMKLAGFGVKYLVEGISDGTVAINITKDGKTLLSAEGLQQGATCNPKVFEFIDLTKEAETGAVSVVWTRGNGIVEDLGTSYVSFARNKKNVIRLNLGAASSNASMSLETENAEFLGELEKDVTLK